MKVTVLLEPLVRALTAVNNAVESRPAQPVLANVLLNAEGSRLYLATTNLELTIVTWIGAEVGQAGSITLPHRTFRELVNGLHDNRVELQLDRSTRTVHVRSGTNESNIRGIDADEFPALPQGGDPDLVLEGRMLKEMIRHTEFAAAKEDNRPILTGIFTTLDGSTLTMAAADGYRLTVRTATLNDAVKQKVELVIPARSLKQVQSVVSDDEEVEVVLPKDRDLVMFRTKNTEITTALLQGKYPDIRSIIPRSYSTTTTADKVDLLRAAKNAAVFARDNANSARMAVRPAAGPSEPAELTLSGRSAERGDNTGQLFVSAEGEPLEISFNVQYLIDVLNVLEEAQVLIESNGPASPGVVRPVGREDFVHVIMPMSGTR